MGGAHNTLLLACSGIWSQSPVPKSLEWWSTRFALFPEYLENRCTKTQEERTRRTGGALGEDHEEDHQGALGTEQTFWTTTL